MRLTTAQRQAVFHADGYRCVASLIDRRCGPCRNWAGSVIDTPGPMRPDGDITVEHVTPGYGRMGRRADNLLEQMVTLCWGHHQGNGVTGAGGSIWALAHKDELRSWLMENRVEPWLRDVEPVDADTQAEILAWWNRIGDLGRATRLVPGEDRSAAS